MPEKRTVVLDSCLRQVWHDKTGRHERRKRRPVGSVPETCTWVLNCPDHPEKNRTSRSVLVDDEVYAKIQKLSRPGESVAKTLHRVLVDKVSKKGGNE